MLWRSLQLSNTKIRVNDQKNLQRGMALQSSSTARIRRRICLVSPRGYLSVHRYASANLRCSTSRVLFMWHAPEFL